MKGGGEADRAAVEEHPNRALVELVGGLAGGTNSDGTVMSVAGCRCCMSQGNGSHLDAPGKKTS